MYSEHNKHNADNDFFINTNCFPFDRNNSLHTIIRLDDVHSAHVYIVFNACNGCVTVYQHIESTGKRYKAINAEQHVLLAKQK